jgi:hypothetical protein
MLMALGTEISKGTTALSASKLEHEASSYRVGDGTKKIDWNS